jgi:hypothetical protein
MPSESMPRSPARLVGNSKNAPTVGYCHRYRGNWYFEKYSPEKSQISLYSTRRNHLTNAPRQPNHAMHHPISYSTNYTCSSLQRNFFSSNSRQKIKGKGRHKPQTPTNKRESSVTTSTTSYCYCRNLSLRLYIDSTHNPQPSSCHPQEHHPKNPVLRVLVEYLLVSYYWKKNHPTMDL